jgi:hypothetical protein
MPHLRGNFDVVVSDDWNHPTRTSASSHDPDPTLPVAGSLLPVSPLTGRRLSCPPAVTLACWSDASSPLVVDPDRAGSCPDPEPDADPANDQRATGNQSV